MATLMDAYQSAVLGAQNIQEKQFEIDAYKKQLSDQVEADKTYAESMKQEQPKMVGGYQEQKGPPSLAQGILPGESGGMPTTKSPTGTPMPSFMGGAKAEEAAKQPVAPEAPATPMAKMQESKNQVEGLSGVLQRNSNAIKLANSKGNWKMANALALQNEELQNKHDKAKVEHLQNVQTSFEIGGQLVRGYEADIKANPADEQGAWARFVLSAQSELGITGDQLLQARTPQERASLVAEMKGRAEKGTDILKNELAQAKLDMQYKELDRKKERDRYLRTLGDQKEFDKQRSLARLEITQRFSQGYDLSESEREFLSANIDPKTGQWLPGKEPKDTSTEQTTAPVSVRNNNPLNLVDTKSGEIKKFNTIEEGTAAGKADLASKLYGTSPAYKARFGNEPVTPAHLAEVWSPANAKGNTPESTANYSKTIADSIGIGLNDTIDPTPENQQKIFDAMSGFEAGAYKPTDAKPLSASEEAKAGNFKLLYDKKQGGELTKKEWDTINPTAVQIGQEYNLPPIKLASASPDEKKQTMNAFQVTKLAEDSAQYIKEHPKAVGTLASLVKSVGGMTGNLQDNLAQNKKYTGEVAILGKKLFALGLKDAAASSNGRMNVFLEKSFAKLYDQSNSAETLLGVIKARQDESFDVLKDTYGADRNVLDNSKYQLANSKDSRSYLGENYSIDIGNKTYYRASYPQMTDEDWTAYVSKAKQSIKK